MDKSYWQGLHLRRVSRRTALAAAAAGAGTAALLAACGSGTSDSGKEASGLVEKVVDRTREAKRGGTIKDRAAADAPTLDLLGPAAPWNSVGPMVYNSLVAYEKGYITLPQNEIGPDLMESWEFSPDGLQITLRLRQGVKWHNKPPVNGRLLDMDDVLFTWQRFTAKHAGRTNIANSVNPDAPVLSLTAQDSRTLVMKLKEPVVYVLGLFAVNWSSGMNVVPKETDTTWDPRADMIGTGPFVLTSYTPSVGYTLQRNPEYWDKDYALVDQVDVPIVSEYATALAQLKAGNLHSLGAYAAGVAQEDILPVKQEEPRLAIYANPGVTAVTSGNLAFGWLPAGRSIFLDERVRQAVSMAIDRDLFIDTFANVSKFESQGLPVEVRWNTALPATSEGWWLDPKGKDFGPNAKYFAHNVEEAKKLLAAAGYPNGFEVVSRYVTGTQLGTTFPRAAEVIDGMMADIGIRTRVEPIDYATEYIPRYRDGKGQYEGWAYRTSVGAGYDYIGRLAGEFWPRGGPAFYGFSTTGQNDMAGDPQVNAMIERARLERDINKQKELAAELQRYLAKPCYMIPAPGGSTTFAMAWPALANFKVFPGGPARGWLNYKLWLDQTKPPFVSS